MTQFLIDNSQPWKHCPKLAILSTFVCLSSYDIFSYAQKGAGWNEKHHPFGIQRDIK